MQRTALSRYGRPRLLRSVLVAAILSLGAGTAGAQSLVSGTVTGTVRAADGGPVPGAFVTLTGDAGASRFVEADPNGAFRMPALPPGSYELFTEALGYRPVRTPRIDVGPGREVTIALVLSPADPPVTRVDTVAWHGRGTETGMAGASQWLSDLELAGGPDRGRTLVDAVRWSSLTAGALDVQGLRAGLTSALIDGLPVAGTRHPALAADPLAGSEFARMSFRRAELVVNDADVERSEFSAGQLTGFWQRGTRTFRARAFGDWSGDALASADHFAAPQFSSARGGLLLAGPIIPDTAHFLIGVEAHREETPHPRPWAASAADSAILASARDSFEVDLQPFFSPRIEVRRRLMAFGRLDWQVADMHRLDVWTSVGSSFLDNPVLGPGAAPNLGTRLRSTDVTAGGSLTSRIAADAFAELRLGLERGDREYRTGRLAPTTFAGSGIGLGTEPALPASVGRTAVRGSGTVHYRGGSHQIKLGVGFSTLAYGLTYAFGRTGAFVFADGSALGRGEGLYTRAVGPDPAASFSTQQFAAWLQDTWTVAPGFDFRVGLRFEYELQPTGDIVTNEDWARLTGIRSDSLSVTRAKFSPRIGFSWRLGEGGGWQVRGQTGIYYDRVDPALVGELITHAGLVRTRRGLGTLGTWPGVPDDVAAPDRGPRLTLLGPDFEAPRTGRASLGITRFFGRGAAMHVSGSYRHTDFLPRRTDLNLLPGAAVTDQHGRPVFGTLEQQGALVATTPGSNRRFPDFDLVQALNADGYSNYFDVTVGLESRSDRLDLVARYTYSRTEDNWLAADALRLDEAFTPFPEDPTWAEGTSDLDVPHRFIAGAQLALFNRHVRLGGFYRVESGRPFTPGFPAGVDVNGDGFAGNDPAFVDPEVEGMDAMIGAWDCLRQNTGRFVERNACRDETVRMLDLRFGLAVTVAGYPVEATLELLNVLDAPLAVPDRALYLIDADQTLTTDSGTGEVALPLAVNPRFGEPIQRLGTGRAMRLGMRVNY